MQKLSIVVPIYNVEHYLRECLESILDSLNRSEYYKENTEIILVNDGSTDTSGEIAKEYAVKNNLIYVEKVNGGLSDARNVGIEKASGKFISFIDSDDKISRNYFEEIFRALENDYDLIIFDWDDYFSETNRKRVSGMDVKNNLWSVQPSAWNKVYKKEFFNDIKFPINRIYEDVGTIYKILSKIKNYIYIELPLYLYRKGRGNSILTTISPKINDIYFVLEDTYQYYMANFLIEDDIKIGLGYQYIKLLMWSNMYRQVKFYKINFLKFYFKMKDTRMLINKKFPEWKTNFLIMKNKDYFSSRYGKNYISEIDKMGKNFFSTLYVLLKIILLNLNRK